ncbi:hypothetical protein NOK12_35900 [Nocardioides sp. OK12]|uniref:peptidoglycan DD-metalloendopeptidase family protein n=1 Tax=Nocardioides sp. OK12 TaxID=2758661 RepID=UPI0021C39456|nr:peptidoglycan DD-metalloendopeptidase family protein [Nocardioides sp. OK12]GHJ61072.1 hypothetical protein NOK12_35900 [Nocardioides sp. OK12]
MGHNRAERPDSGRGQAGTLLSAEPTPGPTPQPYVGRRRAAVTEPVEQLENVEAAPATPYVGRRRAAAPAPEIDTSTIERVLADLEPVDQTTSFASEQTMSLPLASLRTSDIPSPAPAGKRRAERTSRPSVLRRLPSGPVLLGVAALAVSIGGVLSTTGTADTELASAAPAKVGQAGALSGSMGQDSVLLGREGVVSRDSSRDALEDASGGKLAAKVEQQAEQRNAELSNLAAAAEKHAKVLEKNLWQLPVAGYRLTAEFGDYGLWASYHTGLDFAAPAGTPIQAVANGTITSAGYDGSYGNKTVLTLEDGTEIWYAHQTSINVSVGESVTAGETIGTVGSTGNSTGAHLHLEVRPGGGDPVDPYAALVARGITP